MIHWWRKVRMGGRTYHNMLKHLVRMMNKQKSYQSSALKIIYSIRRIMMTSIIIFKANRHVGNTTMFVLPDGSLDRHLHQELIFKIRWYCIFAQMESVEGLKCP
jgi:hypothetical protein